MEYRRTVMLKDGRSCVLRIAEEQDAEACIQCAKEAGYAQLELEVVTDNRRALALYQHIGFMEYGRNPKGFCSRLTGWQEVVLMRLDLEA